jgi:hypothetical protein
VLGEGGQRERGCVRPDDKAGEGVAERQEVEILARSPALTLALLLIPAIGARILLSWGGWNAMVAATVPFVPALTLTLALMRSPVIGAGILLSWGATMAVVSGYSAPVVGVAAFHDTLRPAATPRALDAIAGIVLPFAPLPARLTTHGALSCRA